MPKRRNNHGAAAWPNEDVRAVERAFLRLGNVLAEIAEDIDRKKANISDQKNKDGISTSQSETRKG